jgi:hypothetical protein
MQNELNYNCYATKSVMLMTSNDLVNMCLCVEVDYFEPHILDHFKAVLSPGLPSSSMTLLAPMGNLLPCVPFFAAETFSLSQQHSSFLHG